MKLCSKNKSEAELSLQKALKNIILLSPPKYLYIMKEQDRHHHLLEIEIPFKSTDFSNQKLLNKLACDNIHAVFDMDTHVINEPEDEYQIHHPKCSYE